MCVSTYVSLVKFHVELGFFKLVTDTGQTKAGTTDCRLSDSPSAAVEEGRISNESSGM